MLRGCKVFSSLDSQALHIQQNLTGLPPPYRQAAIALGNWVLTDGGAAGREHRAGEEELHGLPGCLDDSHLVAMKGRVVTRCGGPRALQAVRCSLCGWHRVQVCQILCTTQ